MEDMLGNFVGARYVNVVPYDVVYQFIAKLDKFVRGG